jgi:pimeloyl-ACP methyl ester carboxylesterase
VQNAVRFLEGRDDFNPGAIGLFGISQGGWLAPLVATRTNQVSFIVMLGGPAVSIWQQELDRVEYSMRAGILGEEEPESFSENEIAEALAHTRLAFTVAENPERWNDWEKSVSNAQNKSWAEYVNLDSTVAELQDWLRFKYDPADALRNLKVPILALFGENDVLVPPAENVSLLEKYLEQAKNDKSIIVVFPGVGHDFFTGASLVGGEWDWPTGFWRWNRRATGLEDTIITWVNRQVGR